MDYVKLALLGVVTLVAAIAINWARDLAFQVHAVLIMLIAGGMFVWVLRGIGEPAMKPVPDDVYHDGIIRAGVIATAFWGIVGFLVGTFDRLPACLPA